MDSQGLIYFVDREPNPAIVVFDREGSLVREWGNDIFPLPHDIWIDHEDRVFVTDVADHTVSICTPTGEVIGTLGTPGKPGEPGLPFNQPTRAVTAPDGEILVADGYGQQYVHRFDRDGKHLQTWGGRGSGSGQFTLPHNVFVASDDVVVVLDREPNNRICFFDREGNFKQEWPAYHGPCGVYVDADGMMYLADTDLHVLDPAGERVAHIPLGDEEAAQRHGTHSVWADHNGDLYVGEVGLPNLFYKFARVH